MKRYLLSIGIIWCIGYSVNAQVLKPVPVEYTHNKIQQNVFQRVVSPNENTLHASVLPMQLLSKLNFKYELPRGAIFCRMEDAIYNKLNFWVKFRMGTDEKYSN